MLSDPIPGLSDQRYFHVALLAVRSRDFSMDWLWGRLRKDCMISRGRHKKADIAVTGLEFRMVHAEAKYARSGSREALAISGSSDECAYDVFGCMADGIVVFGTGYAALTRDLVKGLVRRDLITKTRFMVPKLRDIVKFCRSSDGQTKLPMRFTVTGFNAFIPGKNLRQIRLTGTDVFNSGLVEQIEQWLENRGSQDRAGDTEDLRSLQYQALRLKAVGTMSGSTVSLGLAGDGGCRIWLRKSAANLPQFMEAVSTLKGLDKFETTTEAPNWSEETEV